MNVHIDTIHWAGLQALPWAIGLFLAVSICLVFKGIKQYKISKILGSKKSVVYMVKLIFFLLGMFFLLVALLRPQWDKKDEIIQQEGRDMLIALDVSRSMLAQDYSPNRLEFAKEKIKKLLSNLSCERVGLILFSGSSVIQCPLTTDYAAFCMFLNQVDEQSISSGTTRLDKPIWQAITVYEAMKDRKTKIVCLFTDGEDFSDNLEAIKNKAAQQGMVIITFGVGTEDGAPIPIFDLAGKKNGYEKSGDGSVIMSKLSEPILKDLANKTGGKYIRITESDDDMIQAVDLVNSFEKDMLEDKKVERFEEKYYVSVAVAFFFFIVEWLL